MKYKFSTNAIIIIIFSLTIIIVKMFLFEIYRVNSNSMFPTLKEGDYLLVWKYKAQQAPIIHKDIIVFKPFKDKNTKYIKRVFGIEGDSILKLRESIIRSNAIDKQVIKVNSNDDRYLQNIIIDDYKKDSKIIALKVNKDCFFVLGDNIIDSYDSRSYGLIKRKDIIGKAELVLFNLSNYKRLLKTL